MSETFFMSWQNAMLTAAISASSEAGTLKGYNLGRAERKRLWRTSSYEAYFEAVFADGTDIEVLALDGTNIGASDQVRHRLYDASGVNILDVTVDADTVSGYDLHIYRLASEMEVKRWRCDITATSRQALNSFQVGRGWAGPIWEPAINMSYGWGKGPSPTRKPRRGTYSGTIFPASSPVPQVLEFSFDFLSEAEHAIERDMLLAVTDQSQILVVPTGMDGDWARDALIGVFADLDLARNSQPISPARYSRSYRVEQDL